MDIAFTGPDPGTVLAMLLSVLGVPFLPALVLGWPVGLFAGVALFAGF